MEKKQLMVTYHGLSWHGVPTLVNEVDCESDNNNKEKKVDL